MKRTFFATILVVSAILVYHGWFEVEVPQTAERLNNDLDEHAIAYEVIHDTPLILAKFGDVVFLDTIELERVSMNIPPFPRWHWTGNWAVISDPSAPATADLSSRFGPTVLFGVVNDDSIATIQVSRQDTVLIDVPVDESAYIVSAENVLLTDTVRFLDTDGNVLISTRPID